ncbi:hypothetical protein SNEBB_004318 [Seison nebaliae]|nr:hypothetical protein SNEBB_004318 [Seison nebaliae]
MIENKLNNGGRLASNGVKLQSMTKSHQFWYYCGLGKLHLAVELMKRDRKLGKNFININWQSSDTQSTPLHVASAQGHDKIVNYLIELNCELDVKDAQGASALHQAAQSGHSKIVDLLASNGANVNLADSSGSTPLHRACYWNRPDAVRTLLDYGANPAIVNMDGMNSLHQTCRSQAITNLIATTNARRQRTAKIVGSHVKDILNTNRNIPNGTSNGYQSKNVNLNGDSLHRSISLRVRSTGSFSHNEGATQKYLANKTIKQKIEEEPIVNSNGIHTLPLKPKIIDEKSRIRKGFDTLKSKMSPKRGSFRKYLNGNSQCQSKSNPYKSADEDYNNSSSKKNLMINGGLSNAPSLLSLYLSASAAKDLNERKTREINEMRQKRKSLKLEVDIPSNKFVPSNLSSVSSSEQSSPLSTSTTSPFSIQSSCTDKTSTYQSDDISEDGEKDTSLSALYSGSHDMIENESKSNNSNDQDSMLDDTNGSCLIGVNEEVELEEMLEEICRMLIVASNDERTRSNGYKLLNNSAVPHKLNLDSKTPVTEMTPLMYACYHGHLNVCRVLIENHCNLNERSRNGWTSLHWAACKNSNEIISLLVQFGADKLLRDYSGRIAKDRTTDSYCLQLLE